MDLGPFFKSIIDQDECQIVICDTAHTILYMNPAAIEQYADDTGEKLIGRSLQDCHPHWANKRIDDVVKWFAESPDHNIMHTVRDERRNKDVYMVALRDEKGGLIGYYEKHMPRSADGFPCYAMGSGAARPDE